MQPRVHSHAAASTSAAAAAAAPAPAAARAAARLPRGQRRPLLLRRPVRAAGLPEGVDSVLTTGTLVASGLAILGSAALSLRAPPPRQQLPPGEADSGSSSSGSQLQRQQQQQREEEEEEGLGTEYGIMGIISCIPLVNWTVRQWQADSRASAACVHWQGPPRGCVRAAGRAQRQAGADSCAAGASGLPYCGALHAARAGVDAAGADPARPRRALLGVLRAVRHAAAAQRL